MNIAGTGPILHALAEFGVDSMAASSAREFVI